MALFIQSLVSFLSNKLIYLESETLANKLLLKIDIYANFIQRNPGGTQPSRLFNTLLERQSKKAASEVKKGSYISSRIYII